ncbi:zinc-ribbon domain-containing protein [Lachnospiraceae bacterium XBD2001]|nr:zinc-ribbon domain-containing protein [Lachnospiraceae bacterium XBD2001]
MFCTKCGKEISETDAFCPSCGEPNPAVKTAETVADATTEAVAEAATTETPATESSDYDYSNPFAAGSTSTVDPANPFAATTPEEPKKKGKIWIPIVAIIAAVVLLASIAYVYSAIIIPGKQRDALLSTTEDTMKGISSGNIAEEDSYYFDTGFALTEADIQDAEDKMLEMVEQQYGVTASDELRTSVDGMFHALLDRMVESYTVDNDSYTRDGDHMSVDVHVTGINLVALQAAMQEEDLGDMAEDYIYDNLDRFMSMSEDEMQAAMVNELLPQIFDLYTQRIQETESTDSTWTFHAEVQNNQMVLTEIDTHGTLSEDSITDIF